MTHKELRNIINKNGVLSKPLFYISHYGVKSIEGYNFAIYFNSFCKEYQLIFEDGKNEELVLSIKDVYEDKAKAQEYFEFGNVARVEKLEMLPWEKINKFAKYKTSFSLAKLNGIGVLDVDIKKDLVRVVFKLCNGVEGVLKIFNKANKENYDEARRLCKKLFIGENNGT